MPCHYEAFLRKVITFAAPTLSHMKVGSLFCLRREEFPQLDACLTWFSECFLKHDIRICVLKECQDRSLIYVYHDRRLTHLLRDPAISAFLESYNYHISSVAAALQDLRHKLTCEDFPHEIGVFLGYPLYDVKMFMNDTSSYKCVGCWKVYGNKKNALKKFHRYTCCTRELTRRLQYQYQI